MQHFYHFLLGMVKLRILQFVTSRKGFHLTLGNNKHSTFDTHLETVFVLADTEVAGHWDASRCRHLKEVLPDAKNIPNLLNCRGDQPFCLSLPTQFLSPCLLKDWIFCWNRFSARLHSPGVSTWSRSCRKRIIIHIRRQCPFKHQCIQTSAIAIANVWISHSNHSNIGNQTSALMFEWLSAAVGRRG